MQRVVGCDFSHVSRKFVTLACIHLHKLSQFNKQIELNRFRGCKRFLLPLCHLVTYFRQTRFSIRSCLLLMYMKPPSISSIYDQIYRSSGKPQAHHCNRDCTSLLLKLRGRVFAWFYFYCIRARHTEYPTSASSSPQVHIAKL